jgi:hypothetical protein
MTTIHADELHPGDVVAYNGRNHRITRVDRRDGWAWPVAADDTGWAIALDHHLIDVQRGGVIIGSLVGTRTVIGPTTSPLSGAADPERPRNLAASN